MFSCAGKQIEAGFHVRTPTPQIRTQKQSHTVCTDTHNRHKTLPTNTRGMCRRSHASHASHTPHVQTCSPCTRASPSRHHRCRAGPRRSCVVSDQLAAVSRVLHLRGGSGGGGVDPFPNDPRHKNVEGLEKTRNQEIHKSSPSPAYKIFGSGGYGPSLGSERGGWPGLPHLCKTDGHLTPWPPRRGLPDRRWWRT